MNDQSDQGNSHSALIGLIVHWWLAESRENRQVLESAPPHRYSLAESGQGDALLCQDAKPCGVVEVEGTRWVHTARKIGHYFDSDAPEYRNISFGLLMMYMTGLKGRGDRRRFPSIENGEVTEANEAIDLVREITKKHPQKAIIVVTIDKEVIPPAHRIMPQSTYYSGRPCKIAGTLYTAGIAAKSITFLDSCADAGSTIERDGVHHE